VVRLGMIACVDWLWCVGRVMVVLMWLELCGPVCSLCDFFLLFPYHFSPIPLCFPHSSFHLPLLLSVDCFGSVCFVQYQGMREWSGRDVVVVYRVEDEFHEVYRTSDFIPHRSG